MIKILAAIFLFYLIVPGLYFFLLFRPPRLHWLFRWGLLLLLVCGTVVPAMAFGRICGTFDCSLTTPFRFFFFEQFSTCVRLAPDFPASLELMQKKIDAGEFLAKINQIQYRPPSPLFLYWPIAALLLCIWAEFLRFAWLRYLLLATLPFFIAGTLAWYQARVTYVRCANRQVLATYEADVNMIDQFVLNADRVTLSREAVAEAISRYLKECDLVCHGEPYHLLEERLFVQPPTASAAKDLR